MGRLDGKVCFVTGAGSGIGAKTAELFAHEGASVIMADMHLAVVLAEARRGCHDLRGVVLEAVRDTDALHLAEDLVFPLDKVLALGVLRVVFDIARLIGTLVRNADLVEDLLVSV